MGGEGKNYASKSNEVKTLIELRPRLIWYFDEGLD